MSRRNLNVDQMGFVLGRAYYNYIGFFEHFIAKAGLDKHIKPGMGSLLFALYRDDDRTISEIANELQIAKSTMTGMVRRMQKAGLLEEAVDERDGRVTRLRLTKLAKSIETRCIKVAAQVEELLCVNFKPIEQTRLRSSLVQLTATMTTHLQNQRKVKRKRGK
jgi:DNA-binding MarR family transcriptional regulator